tara:strand:- start:479 stop:913 length:435 start_codon:yes stop_codon:yes gene_type:complete
MENLLSSIITREACEGFSEYDETFDRMIPTACATLMSVSFDIHPSYFKDEDYNAIAPLALKVATYDIFCLPENREALVEAIGKGFEGVSDHVKLFSIEMTSTTKTKWIARKGKAITRESHHQPQLVITYSEDMRVSLKDRETNF